MDQLDALLDASGERRLKTPPDIEQTNSIPAPSLDIALREFVVMDDKVFNQGFLFHALHKGMTTLQFDNGMGIGVTCWSDDKGNKWTRLQILHAGCGKRVAKQSAPFSQKKAKAKRTVKIENKGKQGEISAW